MRIVSDLHTHSRFAMACSQGITVQGMDGTAAAKGINLLGTGDFTHPRWLAELRASLEPAEAGLFRLRGSRSGVRFVLSAEISTIFSGSGGAKRIHNCVLMPSFDAVDALNHVLSKRGNLESDGRPQISMSAAELVEEAHRADSGAFVFPAHVWTPYFGALGAATGFDSLKEAYEDQEKRILALETGLSSDPPMNWRISGLDKYALLSNSDMHSLPKMGREMNVFEIDSGKLSYREVTDAIKDRDASRFIRTIEFFPQEGKYHFDGHRQCLVSMDPDANSPAKCPVCGKGLVIGVMHRVKDLADRKPGYVPPHAVPYTSMVPLREIIAYTLRKAEASVAVGKMYAGIVSRCGTEFDALLNADIAEIGDASSIEIAQAVQNIRNGKVNIVPGYDGVFGKVDMLGRGSGAMPASSAWRQKRLPG